MQVRLLLTSLLLPLYGIPLTEHSVRILHIALPINVRMSPNKLIGDSPSNIIKIIAPSLLGKLTVEHHL